MTHLVYAAIVDGRAVYVGRTSSLARRIAEHERERTGPFKLHPTCEWVVLRAGLDYDGAVQVETAAIRALDPPCNGSVPDVASWRRLRGLCGSWLRRCVRMVRRGLEAVGAAVVVAGMMWWWLG